MIWYIIKTNKTKQFKIFAKKNFKKYKIWIPPKELFEDSIFINMEDSPIENKYFIFKKLTPDMYRIITEKETKLIELDLEPKPKKIKIGKRVRIVSPLVTFNGAVIKVVKDLVYIKGKVFGKEVRLAVPRDYIENLK